MEWKYKLFNLASMCSNSHLVIENFLFSREKLFGIPPKTTLFWFYCTLFTVSYCIFLIKLAVLVRAFPLKCSAFSIRFR